MADDLTKDELNEVFGTTDSDWKEVTASEFADWDWDDPKCKILEGLLIQKKDHIGANNSNVYIIELKDKPGEVINVWGSTVLDTKFASVGVNEEVRIEYMGEVESKKGGRKYRDFKLFHRLPALKEA
jgi:hypothetical protein